MRFNKTVNKLNEKCVENRYKIKVITQEIVKHINKLCTAVKCGKEKIIQKRNFVIVKFLKKFIITIGLKLLFKKYKKQILITELILIAYETIENSIKA